MDGERGSVASYVTDETERQGAQSGNHLREHFPFPKIGRFLFSTAEKVPGTDYHAIIGPGDFV
jgi:hypothetical protein